MIGNVVADPDIEVESFARDVDKPVEQIEPHIQLRIACGEVEQRRRDDMPPEAEAARHAQRAAGHRARRRYVLDQLIDVVENFFSACEYALARLRYRDAARRAMQKPRTELGLEQRDALADICGRYRELLRRRAEARQAYDDAEHAQVVEVRRFIHDSWKVD